MGTSTAYPAALDLADSPYSATFNVAAAIVAVETALGVNPQGASADMATRIAAIDALIAANFTAAKARANHTGTQVMATISDAAPIATSGSAADLTAGTLPAGRFPALTGDVTTVAGALAATIGSHAVTNSKFRQSAARSVIGVTGNATADVADIQGTASQALVVNNAGTALAFGPIDISQAAATTGLLNAQGFPILTGDVTTAGGALATTIAANAVTNAKFRQGVATSVVGVTGSATGNVADIAATANQVLRSNGAGTALAFGAIDLSQAAAATGVIQAASHPALTGDVTTPSGSVATTIGALKVLTGMIAAGAVTTAKIASGAVTTTEIADGTITTTDISATAGIVPGQLNTALDRIDLNVFTEYTAVTGVWTIGVVTTQLCNGVLINNGGGINAEYKFDHLWMRAGTWRYTLIHQGNTNRGIYTPRIDGANATAGTTFDGYQAAQTNNHVGTGTFTLATSDYHSFGFIAASKNASSSAYIIDLSALVLVRTGA